MFSSCELCPELCLRGGKNCLPPAQFVKGIQSIREIPCGKSVCIGVVCSIAEENEATLGWEANKSAGYCLPCAGAAEFLSEDRHPSNDIEPAALGNESLDEERSDNFSEPACEQSYETDSGKDERFQSTAWRRSEIVKTWAKSQLERRSNHGYD